MKNRSAAVVLVLAIAVGLSACAVAPTRVSVSGPSGGIWSPMPPPPRVEVISSPPSYNYFWAPGYWHWEANQHRWVDGHWEQRREREYWVAHRWDRDDHDQWRLNGGYWHHD